MTAGMCIFLYRRPEYASQVLDAVTVLHGLDRLGFIHVMMDAQIKENDKAGEVLRLAESFKGRICKSHPSLPVRLFPSHTRLGCNRSIVGGVQTAFCDADYVVVVEDDILLAPDALLYFLWAEEEYRNRRDVVTVTSFCRLSPEDRSWETNKDSVYVKDFFSPWGWATWRDRWESVIYPKLANVPSTSMPSWDCILWHNGVKMGLVFPHLSRSQNIGLHDGEHMKGYVEEFMATSHSPSWAGGLKDPPVIHKYVEKRL
jgi:hypothetical protein